MILVAMRFLYNRGVHCLPPGSIFQILFSIAPAQDNERSENLLYSAEIGTIQVADIFELQSSCFVRKNRQKLKVLAVTDANLDRI